MNQINLRGEIRNIEYSHTIGDTEYDKAIIIVPKENGEDILSLRFKKLSCRYEEGQKISFRGNIRSYSEKLDNGKNKVNIYVFTYFDIPEESLESNNNLILDGRICKKDKIRLINGRKSLHFILANNIISKNGTQKLNNYIPCIVFDDNAELVNNLDISSKLQIWGKLQSREYIKIVDGVEENHVAHEVIVDNLEKLE